MPDIRVPLTEETVRAMYVEGRDVVLEMAVAALEGGYELGKLSTGLAARLANIPRVTFMFLLGHYGLSPFGETPDELQDDLNNADQASHDE